VITAAVRVLLCAQVAAADTALHLTGMSVSKYDNVVPPSVALGAKATVSFLTGWLGLEGSAQRTPACHVHFLSTHQYLF
jgi:hypothetical protein